MAFLKSTPWTQFFFLFLDVNTEIDILKATVVKVINKPIAPSLKVKLIYTLYVVRWSRPDNPSFLAVMSASFLTEILESWTLRFLNMRWVDNVWGLSSFFLKWVRFRTHSISTSVLAKLIVSKLMIHPWLMLWLFLEFILILRVDQFVTRLKILGEIRLERRVISSWLMLGLNSKFFRYRCPIFFIKKIITNKKNLTDSYIKLLSRKRWRLRIYYKYTKQAIGSSYLHGIPWCVHVLPCSVIHLLTIFFCYISGGIGMILSVFFFGEYLGMSWSEVKTRRWTLWC